MGDDERFDRIAHRIRVVAWGVLLPTLSHRKPRGCSNDIPSVLVRYSSSMTACPATTRRIAEISVSDVVPFETNPHAPRDIARRTRSPVG